MRTIRHLALALLALTLSGPPLPAQSEKSDSTKPSDRWPDRIAGKTLQDFIRELGDRDASVRENAVRTVAMFGPESRQAVPAIINMLNYDTDVSLRVNAALMLTQVTVRDSDEPAAVRALMKRMTDDSQSVARYHAAAALGHFEEGAREAIPSLITASKDRGSWEIRRAALASLTRVGADTKNGPDRRVTQAFLDALGSATSRADDTAKVRLEAVVGLAATGIPSNQAMRAAVVQSLTNRTNTKVERDRTLAVWAYVGLMAVDQPSEAYLAGIARLLKSGDVPTKTHAARALGVLGQEAKAKVPELIDALRDKETSVSGMACWALAEMARKFDPGPEAASALSDLVKRTADAGVKESAQYALDVIKGIKAKKPEKP